MKKLIYLLPIALFLLSCGESINNKDKRNEYWCWFVDEKTGVGKWIPVLNKKSKISGEYTLFYCNGNIFEKGYKKDGKSVDTIYHFDINGKPNYKSLILNDSTYYFVPDGEIVVHYSNCILLEKSEFKNNLPNGKSISYYKNGVKKDSAFHINGKQNGIAHYWFNTGAIMSVVEHKNHLRHGKGMFYYPSGKLEQISHYQEGLLHGLQQNFYTNGMLESEFYMHYDYRDSICSWYHPSGKKKKEALYDNGKLIGEMKEWDEEGNRIK